MQDKEEIFIELERNCNVPNEKWSDWRRHLYEKGWAVVPNVLSIEKSDEYKNKFWDWIEHFGTDPNKVNRNDKSTWTDDKWAGNLHGIFQNYGFAHNQFVWDIKSEPQIISVFKEIYGTDRLLTSYDGGNLSRPVIEDNQRPWYHFDQASNKLGFYCIQGFLNLEDCNDNDGGLIVYQGSHNKHTEFFTKTGETTKGDWYRFQVEPNSLDYFKDCKKIKVNAPKGAIVLWDSRTIHYACPPIIGKGRGNCRTVVYVSYQPEHLATAKDIATKKKAFKTVINTSHWASTNVKLFKKFPKVHGNQSLITNFPVPSENPCILSELTKKLAGLIPYDDGDERYLDSNTVVNNEEYIDPISSMNDESKKPLNNDLIADLINIDY